MFVVHYLLYCCCCPCLLLLIPDEYCCSSVVVVDFYTDTKWVWITTTWFVWVSDNSLLRVLLPNFCLDFHTWVSDWLLRCVFRQWSDSCGSNCQNAGLVYVISWFFSPFARSKATLSWNWIKACDLVSQISKLKLNLAKYFFSESCHSSFNYSSFFSPGCEVRYLARRKKGRSSPGVDWKENNGLKRWWLPQPVSSWRLKYLPCNYLQTCMPNKEKDNWLDRVFEKLHCCPISHRHHNMTLPFLPAASHCLKTVHSPSPFSQHGDYNLSRTKSFRGSVGGRWGY